MRRSEEVGAKVGTSSLKELLTEVRHWLPAQGPIETFIHHNTLHAFEDLPFEKAVELAAGVRQSEPYLPHERFLKEFKTGRILEADLDTALEASFKTNEEKNEVIPPLSLTRKDLRKKLLTMPPAFVPEETIRWIIEQSPGAEPTLQIWKQILLLNFNEEFSVLCTKQDFFEENFIAFASSYLDQGVSYWPMPYRELGFLEAFRKIWKGKLKNLSLVMQKGKAEEILSFILGQKDRSGNQWKDLLVKESLVHPGWAGLFSTLEERPNLLRGRGTRSSLAEYLAVRFLFREIHANENLENTVNHRHALVSLKFTVLNLVIDLNINTSDLKESEWSTIFKEVRGFGDFERRRTFQRAYELTYRNRYLNSLLGNIELNSKIDEPRARYQAVFCLDDREESLRRHLEEIAPHFSTLGVAGFFGVDMWYKGLGDLYPRALCPAVITPKYLVNEVAHHSSHRREFKKMGRLKASRRVRSYLHDHSRNLILGSCFAAGTGLVALLPLFLKTLFPRRTSRLNRFLGRLWFPEVETELQIFRTEENHGENLLVGFTVEEMVSRVENILKAIGMTRNFCPLVFFVGHGSSSLNNPHESAYDCGACGGSRGGPNARAFSQMANLPEVRNELKKRGIEIPSTTHFVGGFHDTCSDAVIFYDQNRIPETLKGEYSEALKSFEHARTLDAHERTRRFESIKNPTPVEALRHVEGRCQDLREPRPECGHATNAVCVVGRRSLTRNLYLDRRTFLASYDPAQDPDGKILAGILAAVIPVCAGISLEYYFSYVDNEKYGCGTKLPHNVTSLLGVMNGRVSDLRTGLTLQMVEIHEPLRLLFVIETDKETMKRIISNNLAIKKLVHNRWIQLCVLAPNGKEIELFESGDFIPFEKEAISLPLFKKSSSYYEGQLDHLWPVRIEGEVAP